MEEREPLRALQIGSGAQGWRIIQQLKTAGFILECVFGKQHENEIRNLFKEAAFCDYNDPCLDFVDDIFDEALEDCDVVIVASPPDTHFDYTLRALEAGKSVFAEKPIALDLEEVQGLARLAEERRIPVVVDHTLCYSEQIEDIIKSCRMTSGLKFLGAVIRYLKTSTKERFLNPVWNLGIHPLAALLRILLQIWPESDIVNLKELITLTCDTQASWNERKLFLYFESRHFEIDFLDEAAHGNMILNALLDFHQAVLDPEHQPISDIAFAVKVTELLLQFEPSPYRSSDD